MVYYTHGKIVVKSTWFIVSVSSSFFFRGGGGGGEGGEGGRSRKLVWDYKQQSHILRRKLPTPVPPPDETLVVESYTPTQNIL